MGLLGRSHNHDWTVIYCKHRRRFSSNSILLFFLCTRQGQYLKCELVNSTERYLF